MKTIASPRLVAAAGDKSSKINFTTEQFDNFMKGYTPSNVIGKEWEKKGEKFVQYSVYDDSVNCVSSGSLNLKF